MSCFNLAASKFGFELDAGKLIMLSESKFSVKDMDRLSGIIKQKLNLGQVQDYTTASDCLQVFMEIFQFVAYCLDDRRFLSKILEVSIYLCTLENIPELYVNF